MKKRTRKQVEQIINNFSKHEEKGTLQKDFLIPGVNGNGICYKHRDGNIGYLHIPAGGSFYNDEEDKTVWEKFVIAYGNAIVNGNHLQQGQEDISSVGDTHYAVNCSITDPLLIFYRKRKEPT